MGSERRRGLESSKSRALLVDAAERLICEEGAAAVSARRVAEIAGLKPQLVHYYFADMDELFLAVLRRLNERRIERHAETLHAQRPLQALWEANQDRSSMALGAEFISLAMHRREISAEIVRSAERFRQLQAALLDNLLQAYGVPETRSAGLILILNAVARAISTEAALGISCGHAEAIDLVEGLLGRVESRAARPVA